MSKRLGDDPLSRQRKSNSKNGRTGGKDHSSSGVSDAASNYPLSTQPQLRPESITEVPSSTSASLSYNDVFFRRRSDNEAERVDEVSGYDTVEQTVAGPVVPARAVTEPSPLDQATSAQSASSLTMPTLDGAASPPQSPSEMAASLENTAPLLAEVDLPNHAVGGVGQPKGQEAGFLKRLFGRLRK